MAEPAAYLARYATPIAQGNSKGLIGPCFLVSYSKWLLRRLDAVNGKG